MVKRGKGTPNINLSGGMEDARAGRSRGVSRGQRNISCSQIKACKTPDYSILKKNDTPHKPFKGKERRGVNLISCRGRLRGSDQLSYTKCDDAGFFAVRRIRLAALREALSAIGAGVEQILLPTLM